MARTKISEFSATAADNTDIDSIDIAEGCAPSGINNAIRELMAQLKDFQTGTAGDPFNGSVNGTVGATTPNTVVATQVDITAQGDLRLQDTTGGQYVALQAPGTIATSYILTLPVDDGTAGQVLITDGSGVLSWAASASGDVTLTGTQTLTNKTISTDNNTINGIAASSFVLSNASGVIDGSAAQKIIPAGVVVGTTDSQTLTNKTLTDPAIIGTVLEDVFTITDGAAFEIDPGNGSIQLITLGANRTPKATNFAAGEAITLMVDDGTAYALTWTDTTFGTGGVIWETDSGVAPTLSTTGYTTIALWKVASQVYGARVGNA